MRTDELREKYLEFYESKGHTRKPSDVLVPHDDPSVLFTPAGMNQFKDHFLGKVRLDFTRATTCQKCLRSGDIDNVGRTPRHHTFFEMLGNFSFGDYFKREAIHWAWEFLTDKSWLGIDPTRLTISVYLDDDEAANIWHQEIGVPTNRIERMDEADNFWPASAPSQGPDGVCGPCSEIFYTNDDGSSLEIWNLVFTQFNRLGEPPENLQPLPSKNIDTGMGLERTAAVLQGVNSNFHIDILQPIVDAAAEVCGRSYDPDSEDGRRLRRITDHVRACTFAIHENVEPGNHKQNYVIRRLLRRAVLDGHQMSMREPFLHQLVPTVVDMMQSAYPELRETVSRVQTEVKQEEASFFQTIDEAVRRINDTFEEFEAGGGTTVSGERAGDLYTTYGVPPELFEQLARDRGFEFDWSGYRTWMEEHGRKSGGDKHALFQTGAVEQLKGTEKETVFTGYETTSDEATIRGIVAGNEMADKVSQSDDADSQLIVVLDKTPFYAESGGQVGDSGFIRNSDFNFQVNDTQKDSDLILHIGKLVSGTMTSGDTVTAAVDVSRRSGVQRAHSATHLLHSALQNSLGDHAQQRGSKVEEDLLRFDFKNREQVGAAVVASIESEVGNRIKESAPVSSQSLPIEEARSQGAMMLFGEKYPDVVRMVSIGDFSKELCGGTHVSNTRDVGRFEIIAEESVSAGTRRIVALTGDRAIEHEHQVVEAAAKVAEHLGVSVGGMQEEAERVTKSIRRLKKHLASGTKPEPRPYTQTNVRDELPSDDYPRIRQALRDTARIINVPLFDAPDRIAALISEQQQLTEQLEQLEVGEATTAESLLASATQIAGVTVIAADIPDGNPGLMRKLIDQIRKQVNPAAIILGAKQGDDKSMLVAGITHDLVERGLSAGKWINEAATVVGGRGGGKPDMAQAGGKSPEKLPEAMQHAVKAIEAMLANA